MPSPDAERPRARFPWGLIALAVVAGLVVTGSDKASGQDPAEKYMTKMAEASDASYQARKLVVYFGEPRSTAIVEVQAGEGGRFVRAETGGEFVRMWNGGDHGLVTEGEVRVHDARPPSIPFRPKRVLDKFHVHAGSVTPVAGVGLVPLDLVRKSDGRMIERIWVHPDNGVVYRRELFDRGGLLAMTEMLDMKWGEKAAPAPRAVGGQDRAWPARDGRAPKALPYDYGLVSTHELDTEGRRVNHWVYSDGMHTLSVFHHEGSLNQPDGFSPVDLGRTAGFVGPGPGTWAWQGGRSVYVVVAEETQLDPAELTKNLAQGDPSRVSRLGAWWAKGYRWVADLLG